MRSVPLLAKSPSQLIAEAQGLKFENFYRGSGGLASQAFTNQTAVFTLVGLPAGFVITNLYFCCSSAIQTITTNKMGIYSTAGSRLAISANNTTNVAAGMSPAYALTAAYTVPATGAYYIALLTDATTPGAFFRGGGTSGQGNALGSNPTLGGTQASQADLPASATIANSTQVAWVGGD